MATIGEQSYLVTSHTKTLGLMLLTSQGANFAQHITKKTMNPAARLLKIYDKLVGQQTDQSMVKTWAAVFDLDGNDPHLEDKVVGCVVALRQQIDFTSVHT